MKSKIKQNPYAQFYLNQIEMIEQQRQYWLKHPDVFINDLTRMLFSLNKNVSFSDIIKLEKMLEKK